MLEFITPSMSATVLLGSRAVTKRHILSRLDVYAMRQFERVAKSYVLELRSCLAGTELKEKSSRRVIIIFGQEDLLCWLFVRD